MNIANESASDIGLRLSLGAIADPFAPLVINRKSGYIMSAEWLANHYWHVVDASAYIGLL